MKIAVLIHLTVMFTLGFAFEPFTTGVLIGAAALGGGTYSYFDKIKQHTYCKFNECCNEKLIPYDIDRLSELLEEKLFGQHIVREKVHQAVTSHYKGIEKSKKPLVMAFLGTQGTGKNFVSNLIAEAVFEKGSQSKFYHVFHGSQFLDSSRLREYQEQIKGKILAAVKSCGYSIFVFDEVDKMPQGIFDSITAMLDNHPKVNDLDFRRAVFIFLTNYGGAEITKVLYKLTVADSLYRHETRLHHFEAVSKVGELYNRKGGLKESQVIVSEVIDFYLPFLPLEHKHIVQCIKTEYENYGRPHATEEMIEEILNYISFHPVTKFANTGCKSVHAKVRAECL